MKRYEIKYESINGIDKYNIYYYINGELESKEFYAYDLNEPISEIRFGYKPL